tara:strand:- start:44 stop:421 length:378 start_codon:yes stop_codon:yes gene_type:complete
MTAQPVDTLPLIVFSTLSLILPVATGIAAKSWRAFRISLMVGLFTILGMLCGPFLVSIGDAPAAYTAAAGLVIFPFIIGHILATQAVNDTPDWIYLLYATPIALAAWLVLAQLLAWSAYPNTFST